MSEKYISKEELRSFIERALEYKNSINKIYLGKVSKDVSQKIYDLLPDLLMENHPFLERALSVLETCTQDQPSVVELIEKFRESL